MHERVSGYHQLETGFACAPAVIVVFEIADTEPLVEVANLFAPLRSNEQAETDKPINWLDTAVICFTPRSGELIDRCRIARVDVDGSPASVRHIDLLRAADKVRARPDHADLRITVEHAKHP